MSTATALNTAAAGTRYGLLRTVDLSYEQAVARITETLKGQGFGILTEIDVQATLKKKLDQDFTPYIILGACNPPLAFRALSAEIDIGLLLPCNVNVYVDPKSGKTVVAAIDPQVLVEVTGRSELKPIADEVKGKLQAAIDAV
ncbi:MAG TPA: DUF302 domain-containing protein [bacterium]|jgi:uncharacterized protein (DUF302 family)